MKRLCNLSDLRKTVGFVLSNSEFDEDSNMTEVSQLLVANSSRVLALTSKLEYMTLNAQRAIETSLTKLDFAADTVREEKITARVNLASSQCESLKKFNLKVYQSNNKPAYYPEYRNMSVSVGLRQKSLAPVEDGKGLAEVDGDFTPIKKKVNFNMSRVETEAMTKQYSVATTVSKAPQLATSLRFHELKHASLQKGSRGNKVTSSINALVPQFALAEPHVELQPLKTIRWTVKIGRCRNLSCLNTLAVGLVHRKEI